MTPNVESWLPVPEYEGVYEVSSLGRIRSLHKRNVGLILKQQSSPFGYPIVTLKLNGDKRTWCVHTLVASAFHGRGDYSGLQVRHLDGDATNNAAVNLQWGTQSENNYDTVRHGTHVNRRKTQCLKGHPLSGSNLYEYRGRRCCRTCMSRRTVEWQRRKAKGRNDAAVHV